MEPPQETPNGWDRLGHHYLDTGDFRLALRAFRRAVHLDPSNQYRPCVAEALSRLGRLSEAIRECRRTLRIEKQDAMAWDRLGHLLWTKDPSSALAAFTRATRLAPNYPRYHLCRADFLSCHHKSAPQLHGLIRDLKRTMKKCRAPRREFRRCIAEARCELAGYYVNGSRAFRSHKTARRLFLAASRAGQKPAKLALKALDRIPERPALEAALIRRAGAATPASFRLEGPRSLSFYDACFFCDYRRSGVSFSFDARCKLDAADLYSGGADGRSQYRGPLPAGISFSKSRAEIESVLGSPQRAAEGKRYGKACFRARANYPGMQITYRTLSSADRRAKPHIIRLILSA